MRRNNTLDQARAAAGPKQSEARRRGGKNWVVFFQARADTDPTHTQYGVTFGVAKVLV